MYLMSLFAEKAIVEASLGGHVTADEVNAFASELDEFLLALNVQKYNLLLDYSKASMMTGQAAVAMEEIKDRCLDTGAMKIVTVAQDQDEANRQTSIRIQNVLDGREQFVVDPESAEFERIVVESVRRAA